MPTVADIPDSDLYGTADGKRPHILPLSRASCLVNSVMFTDPVKCMKAQTVWKFLVLFHLRPISMIINQQLKYV